MKIAIDEKVCTKHKLTVEEMLLALCFRHIKNPIEVKKNLLSREVLVVKDGKTFVTQHWSEVLDEIIADSLGEQDEGRLKQLATELRKVYPEGRMIDKKTGQPTSFYFRCNVPEVMKKLKSFFVRYKDFIEDCTDEDIIDATKRYVADAKGNYQQAGFRQLKYFIFKDNAKQGPDGKYIEPISQLLDYLQNEKGSGEEEDNTESWTTKMI